MSQIKIELPQPYYDILKKRAEENYQSLRAYATNVLARFCSDKLIDFSNPETIPDYVTIKIDTKSKTESKATPSLDTTKYTRSRTEAARFAKDNVYSYLERPFRDKKELDFILSLSNKDGVYSYDKILYELKIKSGWDKAGYNDPTPSDELDKEPAPPAYLEEVNTIQEKIFNTINTDYPEDKDELISIFNKIKDYCLKNDCLASLHQVIEYPGYCTQGDIDNLQFYNESTNFITRALTDPSSSLTDPPPEYVYSDDEWLTIAHALSWYEPYKK